jgi:hypothetical protein
VSFFLESTLVGRLALTATKGIFTPLLRSTAFFLRLPRTPARAQLVDRAKRLAAMNLGRRPPEETLEAVVQSALGKAISTPGGGKLADQLPLYHDSLVALATGRWDPTNVAAAAKAVRDAASKREAAREVVPANSPGVAIVGEAMTYAAQTRLALRIRHARTEALVRAGAFTPADLGLVAEAFDCGDLSVDGREGGPPIELGQLRNQYLLMSEAVIWARLHGFVPNKSPDLLSTQGGFANIPLELSAYWRERFPELVDTWAAPKGRIPGAFRDHPAPAQAMYLREFFWDIVRNLPKLPDGALTVAR